MLEGHTGWVQVGRTSYFILYSFRTFSLMTIYIDFICTYFLQCSRYRCEGVAHFQIFYVK